MHRCFESTTDTTGSGAGRNGIVSALITDRFTEVTILSSKIWIITYQSRFYSVTKCFFTIMLSRLKNIVPLYVVNCQLSELLCVLQV
jgi:hypothetical protein